MPEEAEREARRELDRLSRLPTAAAEYGVIRTYLDWMVSLPWNITTEDNLDIQHARAVLDEDHYGLEDVKERILEYLSVRKLRQERADETRPHPEQRRDPGLFDGGAQVRRDVVDRDRGVGGAHVRPPEPPVGAVLEHLQRAPPQVHTEIVAQLRRRQAPEMREQPLRLRDQRPAGTGPGPPVPGKAKVCELTGAPEANPVWFCRMYRYLKAFGSKASVSTPKKGSPPVTFMLTVPAAVTWQLVTAFCGYQPEACPPPMPPGSRLTGPSGRG